MGWACSTHGSYKKRMQNIDGKPEGDRPTEKHKRRLEGNIKVVIK
jgi:hypothetical protein